MIEPGRVEIFHDKERNKQIKQNLTKKNIIINAKLTYDRISFDKMDKTKG